jgi:hypothetical protein
LRSSLNPELAADPLPLLGAGEVVPLACDVANPFPPEALVPFPGGGVSPGEFAGAHPGVVSNGETASVDSVADDPFPISDQVSWRRVFGERFQDLLSGLSRRRMFGHVEMHHPASTMGQNRQNEQNPKSRGRQHKEID